MGRAREPRALLTRLPRDRAGRLRRAGPRVIAGSGPPEGPTPARSSVLVDRGAGGSQRVPGGAEVLRAFPRGLTCLLVEQERVERVALVRHLHLPVLALRRAEKRALYPALGDRLAGREEGRPVGRALAVAVARRPVVGAEEVERVTVRGRDCGPDRGVPPGDHRSRSC